MEIRMMSSRGQVGLRFSEEGKGLHAFWPAKQGLQMGSGAIGQALTRPRDELLLHHALNASIMIDGQSLLCHSGGIHRQSR